MPYLLDSNVFIQAKNLHYGFDFCPAFWEWWGRGNAAGTVFSIEKVHDELIDYEDELSEWARRRSSGFFLSPGPSDLPSPARVSSWASSQRYDPAAVGTFLQIADFYLVAQALSGGYTVITHETPSSSVKKIKIPDACIGLGVKFATPYDMLRREKARFVLGHVTPTPAPPSPLSASS